MHACDRRCISNHVCVNPFSVHRKRAGPSAALCLMSSNAFRCGQTATSGRMQHTPRVSGGFRKGAALQRLLFSKCSMSGRTLLSCSWPNNLHAHLSPSPLHPLTTLVYVVQG